MMSATRYMTRLLGRASGDVTLTVDELTEPEPTPDKRTYLERYMASLESGLGFAEGREQDLQARLRTLDEEYASSRAELLAMIAETECVIRSLRSARSAATESSR